MFTGLQVTLTFHLPGSLVFLLTQLIMLYQAKQFNTDTLFAIQQLSIVVDLPGTRFIGIM